ncbi:serine hydrolase [Sphingobacteriales bacterium CHB3]|nr:serine hydrolase [Sphingobacteriales bacterium CHB3]
MRLLSSFLLVPFLFLSLSAQPSSINLKQLDAHIAKVMKEFEVPGLAVAIVKDGKVAIAKGYGVKKMGGSDPVDAATLFGIASNSKAFTATALGILVEEGKVEWDAPVINYLPAFQLIDPYITRELTVRDLLVHRSGLGLGAGDLLWWPASTHSRQEITKRLRYVPLATSFRSAYAYDNVLYNVAGDVIEAVSGLSWEEFVQTRILDKLGMSATKPRCSAVVGPGNISSTHAIVDKRLQLVKPFIADNANPAAGITTNVTDIAKWLIVQLDSGRVAGGAPLFSPKTAKELWGIVTPISVSNVAPELAAIQHNFSGYGLGFLMRDFRGQKLVTHGGALPGYYSTVAMIPGLRLGIAVLTNQESSRAMNAIAMYILDRFLGAPALDYVSAYKRIQARADSTTAAKLQSTSAARNATSSPSLSLEQYAGTYQDSWYGDIILKLEDGKLAIAFAHTPELSGTLEHWQYDTFVARWHDRELRADAYLTFSLNPDGTIEQAKMKAFSPDTDFSFDFHHLLLKKVEPPTR